MPDQIICGEASEEIAKFPDGYFDCLVTSPPYWALREYDAPPQVFADGWEGQLGLEPHPSLYLEHLWEIFDAIRPKMKETACVFVIIADTYAGSQPKGIKADVMDRCQCMIPERFAWGMIERGWCRHNDITWHKTNSMCGSQKNRFTCTTEHVYYFSKVGNPYFDLDAVREKHLPQSVGRAERLRRLVKRTGRGVTEANKRYGTDSSFASAGLVDGRSGVASLSPLGKNPGDCWDIATMPFSGAQYLADHVGDDGKFYKASADCPVHGHLVGSGSPRKAGRGGRRASPLNHIPDTANGRAQELPLAYSSTACQSRESPCSALSSVDEHSPQNTDGHRTDASLPQKDKPQKHPCTAHIGQIPVSSSDSPSRECSQTATAHSNQSHKTGRAPETNPSYRPCGETSGHIAGTPIPPENTEHDGHTPANNNEEGVSSNEKENNPSARIDAHNGRKSIRSCPNGNIKKCTCQEVNVDHFATYPPELIRKPIRAGCPPKVCVECGKPWVRIVEKTSNYEKREPAHAPMSEPTKVDSTGWRPPTIHSETWEPTCECGGETEPGILVDPFVGSGTSLIVAVEEERRGVGFDLSEEYCEMARRRIEKVRRKHQPRLEVV